MLCDDLEGWDGEVAPRRGYLYVDITDIYICVCVYIYVCVYICIYLIHFTV